MNTLSALSLENFTGETLTNDGWALLAPYGEHRKVRQVIRNGQVVNETYVQVVDEAAVDELIANENGSTLLGRLKRAIVKRPVFREHPDLGLHSPGAVNHGNTDLTPIGLIDGNRKSARGFESQFSLTEAGASAVENDGCKFPSAHWLVKPTGEVRADGAIVVRPFKILSVGLTARPNIPGVESLANAQPPVPAPPPAPVLNPTATPNQPMKLQIINWLATQGVPLANEATEQATFAALTKRWNDRASELLALTNDKSALAGHLTTLTAERDAHQQRANDTATALANAQTALATERHEHAAAVTDLAIAQGRLAVAEREARIHALTNAADFKQEAGALRALPAKFRVTGTLSLGNRKEEALVTTRQEAHAKILSLANHDPRYSEIKDFGEAMKAILADHPALAEQLRTPPEAGH